MASCSRSSPGLRAREAWGVSTWSSPLPEKGEANRPAGMDDQSPSALSRFFSSMRAMQSPEDRAQATLADVADSACRTLHQTSQKHKPCAKLLLEGLPHADRQETLVWLVQAFDVMNFSDSLLFDTALLLDRYYACLPKEDIKSGESQKKLLAAVCMALKTGSNAETQLPLRQVVTHLGHDQVPFDAVMAAELSMLRKLRFDVGTPTACDFLEALSTRLSVFRTSDSCRSLSEFLLQLSLIDAVLHYRYPHAVLAASALLLALSATRSSPAAHAAVFEDLALHCPEAAAPNGSLAQCCAALHVLWVRSFSNQEQSPYPHHLRAKFARVNYHSVSSLQPPAVAPPVSGYAVHLGQGSSPVQQVQDDVDEAVRIVHQSLMMDLSGEYAAESAEVAAGNAREAQQWTAALAARLRGLSQSESSWKVHCVLARHGWCQGRFRRPPDREQLLRDLMRSSKGARAGATTLSAAAFVAAERGTLAVQAVKEAREAQGCAQRLAAGEHRRPRSASWCGQRSSARAAASLLTRSP